MKTIKKRRVVRKSVHRNTPHVCADCGRCCRALAITFSIEDANREPRLWAFAVPIQQVGNPKTREFMAEHGLPWVLDKPDGRGSPCVFLDKQNKCLIYETRPKVCRDYPEDGYCVREVLEVNDVR